MARHSAFASSRNVQSHFAQTPSVKIQRSVFDRSHTYKTTLKADMLVPIYVDEVLPGDTFSLRMNLFCRMQTPVRPLMDNIWLDTHFFFVPSRLLWSNWRKFMGELMNPGTVAGDPDPYVGNTFVPRIADTNQTWLSTNSANGRLFDYFGIPVGQLTGGAAGQLKGINALPFRAYNLIWNEWFRDQNLQESKVMNLTSDGPDAASDYEILYRNKRHDYFTSCLPWPQKGADQGLIVAAAPQRIVRSEGTNQFSILHGPPSDEGHFGVYTSLKRNGAIVEKPLNHNNNDGGGRWNATTQSLDGSYTVPSDPNSDAMYVKSDDLIQKLRVDVDDIAGRLQTSGVPMGVGATTYTINDLRRAFQMQRYYERSARGGTRYTEILQSHFGVHAQDYRLQRPEFLGGSSTPIQIHQVAKTTVESQDTIPLGNLAAYGVAGDHCHGFTKSFVEHGYIIGLASVRADLNYQNGVNRMWYRKTRWDFYWPEFAHLGEQPVWKKELFLACDDSYDNSVFGYQERYAEYRYKPSVISGLFRSGAEESVGEATLDYWHCAQNLVNGNLNSTFIRSTTPIERTITVQDQDQFLFDSYIQLKCIRPMPVYGIPGMSDHF